MIAEQIKALRHRDRLSQKELAKRLAVGQSTIAMWETGTNTARLHQSCKAGQSV